MEAEPGRAAGETWPAAIFDAPVLRGLDARARREIAEAGALRRLERGEVVYRAGDAGDAFFVVASGRVGLRAVRRGDDHETELRAAEAGGAFGEEATAGAARRATAAALEASVIAEIPVHIFRRAAVRSGKAEFAEKLERALRRSATRDLLGTLALTRDLGPEDVDALLDAAQYRSFQRGQAIYREGDPASELWLVADGMVQIQTEEGDRLRVRAYLTRGDFFGDVEIGEARPREASAIASGPSTLLSIPARDFAALARRRPDLAGRLRRIAGEQVEAQQAIVEGAAKGHTAHVFRDLYRLQVARSLLVIDLESCVRCGHCAWACAEAHDDGVSRLVRRGDRVAARLEQARGERGPPQSLLLPSSCQHCEDPSCMIGCPTGAIGKDAAVEVVIREALCTGCASCARACPWDNIQMAPRAEGAPRPAPGGYADVAVKCDLCRGFDGPACVKACPTASIVRIHPAEEIADVRDLLGGARRAAARAATAGPGLGAWARPGAAAILGGCAAAAAGIGFAGVVMHARGLWRPGQGLAWGAGVAAAAGFALLLAYAVPKRAVRLWMRRRAAPGGEGGAADAPPAPSVVRPELVAHLAIGLVTAGLALAHAPWPGSGRATLGGALHLVFWATALAGGLTALAYRLVPRRLARIERAAALPEDFAAAGKELHDRLYREVSGKSDLVKKVFEKILLPDARSPIGPLALVLSGRRLREEERALRARIDAILEGRGAERLGGLAELIRVVVELRALPAQRWLLFALRAGLPVHVVTLGVALALLVLHAATATGVAR
ncbi:MAG: cyclic nucleotide-binding domain-containing protein [Polyangiaceae bacterium]|nr:cyclic nucleotide-binding domain-containing protein [Polyangiaceae bacterium]